MRYKPRSLPMKHQREAMRNCAARPRRPSPEDVFAYLMEMGCGKSATVLYEWQQSVSEGELTDLLVVAPAGSYTNWFLDKSNEQPSELRAHLDPRLLERVVVAGWTDGAESRRQRAKLLATTDRPRAFFVNVEALSTGGRAEECCRMFLSPGRAMMVVDESTTIRGRRAERRKAVMRLRKLAKARRIMTGEIAPRSPLDLFWQFYFLDPRILGYESDVAFRARYAKMRNACFLPFPLIRAKFLSYARVKPDGRSTLSDVQLLRKLSQIYDRHVSIKPRHKMIDEILDAAGGMSRDQMVTAIIRLAGGGYVRDVVPVVDSYQNLEELHEKIRPYSHRVLKRDCLDLRPKIYMPLRDVPLTKDQRRIYDDVLKKCTAELEEERHVTATTVLTKISKLHQIVCGHVRDEEGELHDIRSGRVDAVLELLSDHSGKAIVWTCYDPEVRKLVKAIRREFEEDSCAAFWGANRSTREQDVREFLSNPRCRFMVSTQMSGGLGNTWNCATLTIYAANSWDLEKRIHSEDRNHRKGQTESVTYQDLVARGTVEEKVIHALRSKMNLAAIINGENYREWLI